MPAPAVRNKWRRNLALLLAGEVSGTECSHGRIPPKHSISSSACGSRPRKDPLPPGGSGALPVIPDQDFARFGEVERVSRSRIDKLTATNMVRSWLNVPHVTQFDDADISGLQRLRKDLHGEAAERGGPPPTTT